MRKKIIYTHTEETANASIKSWEKVKKYAQNDLSYVENRTALLEKAIKEKKALDNLSDAYISDDYFQETRKNYSTFTTKLKTTLDFYNEHPDECELSSETLSHLTELHTDAYSWYKSFNKAVSTYKMKRDIYMMCYHCTFVQIL